MKTILFSVFGLLAVAAVGFVVKSKLERPDSQAALAEAKKPEPQAATSSPTGGPGIPSKGQPPAPVQAQMEEKTVWTTPSTRQVPAPANPARSTARPAKQHSAVARNAQPASQPSPGSPAYSSAPSGFNASKQGPPSANPAVTSGAEAVTLELDPGVPVPAALLAPEEGVQSPTVAAAQQQIADSFVQEVDNALSQPESPEGDAAVNEAYYDSLTQANELYRALYGDQAYNNKTMQATLEAQAGQ